MEIAIAGGSGFIGKALTKALLERGYHVIILTRQQTEFPTRNGVTYLEWLNNSTEPEEYLNGIHALINLSGENLNSGRWTKGKKQQLLESRVTATKEVVRIINKLKDKPKVLINGSAIGYYGTSIEETFTESTNVKGNDFLAKVVSTWENEAIKAMDDTRVVLTRFGMVLDTKGGALKKMVLPFKLFLGGNLGSGKQWLSWVHLNDVVNAILHCIDNPHIEGPVNITAPSPVQMNEFGRTLANKLGRPYWAPVPSFLLKILLGEMSVLVLEGQRVLPQKLQYNNFSFQYPTLESALENIIKQNR